MSEGALPSIAPLRPIRFGVLCDGPKIPTWHARSIEELLRIPGTSLALLIFPAEGSSDGSRPRSLLFRAYVASHPPRALRPVDMARALLQRVAGRVGGGIALRTGYFRTALHSLRQNVDEVHFGVAGWPANVCQDLRLGQTAYLEGPSSLTPLAPSRIPSNRQMMQFLVR